MSMRYCAEIISTQHSSRPVKKFPGWYFVLIILYANFRVSDVVFAFPSQQTLDTFGIFQSHFFWYFLKPMVLPNLWFACGSPFTKST